MGALRLPARCGKGLPGLEPNLFVCRVNTYVYFYHTGIETLAPFREGIIVSFYATVAGHFSAKWRRHNQKPLSAAAENP